MNKVSFVIEEGMRLLWNKHIWTIKKVKRGRVFIEAPHILGVQSVDWLKIQHWLDDKKAKMVI